MLHLKWTDCWQTIVPKSPKHFLAPLFVPLHSWWALSPKLNISWPVIQTCRSERSEYRQLFSLFLLNTKFYWIAINQSKFQIFTDFSIVSMKKRQSIMLKYLNRINLPRPQLNACLGLALIHSLAFVLIILAVWQTAFASRILYCNTIKKRKNFQSIFF